MTGVQWAIAIWLFASVLYTIGRIVNPPRQPSSLPSVWRIALLLIEVMVVVWLLHEGGFW